MIRILVVLVLWAAIAHGLAWLCGTPSPPAVIAQVILDVDWDVILALALGIGALGTVVLEYRRTSKLDELAQDMGERIAKIEAVMHDSRDLVDRVARLEATSTDAMTVEQRIATLEVKAERDETLEERIANTAERVAAVETKHDLIERLARLEAIVEERADEAEDETE